MCRRQQQLGLGPAEGDHADAVPAFIGVAQQAEDGSFDSHHAPPSRHRSRGIDDKENQRSRPADSLFAMEVGPQDDRLAIVVKSVAGRGPKRGVNGEVAGRRVGDGSRVAATTLSGRAAFPSIGLRRAVRRDHLDRPGRTA